MDSTRKAAAMCCPCGQDAVGRKGEREHLALGRPLWPLCGAGQAWQAGPLPQLRGGALPPITRLLLRPHPSALRFNSRLNRKDRACVSMWWCGWKKFLERRASYGTPCVLVPMARGGSSPHCTDFPGMDKYENESP
ncbi:hypothetical protein E2C01_069737 [Portunus trituberculatus]|uniref:Uncharacterized protein n=1 Tax=Portunus trituberculatus TaxID=210409 RepID=A0A5B7HQU5_PORTR|nr:hypothetical protein [Portunus trituberculatus]